MFLQGDSIVWLSTWFEIADSWDHQALPNETTKLLLQVLATICLTVLNGSRSTSYLLQNQLSFTFLYALAALVGVCH